MDLATAREATNIVQYAGGALLGLAFGCPPLWRAWFYGMATGWFIARVWILWLLF